MWTNFKWALKMAVHQLLRLQRMLHLQHDIGLQINRNEVPRPRRGLEDRGNPLEVYGDGQFRQRYRLSKPTVIHLCDVLKADLQHPTCRSNAVPVHLQVLTALRFYACGKYPYFYVLLSTKTLRGINNILSVSWLVTWP